MSSIRSLPHLPKALSGVCTRAGARKALVPHTPRPSTRARIIRGMAAGGRRHQGTRVRRRSPPVALPHGPHGACARLR
jgi:hypothetical protein